MIPAMYKPLVLIWGSTSFALIGVLSKITAPRGEGPGGWGVGIVIFYLLQGLGRGVYESTNKGIFLDFFPGDKSPGAFANCMMQSTMASTIGFLLQAVASSSGDANRIIGPLVWVLIICAASCCPGFLLAKGMQKRQAPVVCPST